MPLDSDESSSEPDLSILGMTRAGAADAGQHASALTYEDEMMSHEVFEEAEETSIEGEPEVEAEEFGAPLMDPTAMGLKEISNLGKFTVSSHKQGNGVEELRSDDLKQYWQYIYDHLGLRCFKEKLMRGLQIRWPPTS